VRIGGFGACVLASRLVGDVGADAGGQRARAAAPAAAPIRSIFVVGGAGWEGKYVVAALEERGWPVTARFSIAPNVDVAQGAGSVVTLDTARVAAVIAIDTVMQRYGGAIERFVRSGGGLVLAGPSALAPAAAVVAPGTIGNRFRPAVLPRDTLELGSTGVFPVATLRDDAVAIERRTGGVAIAARRVGAGRVVQVGYDDSWRWRMAGAAGSEIAHREWWSRLVASVAYVPTPSPAATATGGAPVARLVDRLGPASPSSPAGRIGGQLDRRLILALIMILLLAEWTSRRLRGFK
jgi:hypothetical protein